MSANRPMVLIMFGMLLGGSLGFADGLLGLQAWLMLGRPNFFIRPNWGETLHIAILTFGGALAGIVYGGFLIRMSLGSNQRLRLARIYCASMILAMPVFFLADYHVIANGPPLTKATFIPEIAVFLISVILARCIGRDRRMLQGQDRIALRAFGWHRPAKLDDSVVNREQYP